MWGQVINQKHYVSIIQYLWSPNLSGWWHSAESLHLWTGITHQFSSFLRSRDKVDTLYSTCRRPMDTKLGKVLTCREKLPPLKPQDLLIMWQQWGQAMIWKFSISTFTKLMANKLGRMLTLGKRFSTQVLKSSPTALFEDTLKFSFRKAWIISFQ